MSAADPLDNPRFDAGRALALGVEEELLLVDAVTHALAPVAVDVLARLRLPSDGSAAHPDLYAALVELATPPVGDAAAGARALGLLRDRVREAGGTVLGAGIHPDGPFGDVPHVESERYAEVGRQLRGLVRRTPTCALHVHVGMPDAATALRAFNGLRPWLPLLQALAANSPFWHGRDSGLASARAQMFRGYPRADIPQAFGSWDEYVTSVRAVVDAGDLPDYTFMWWDLRPHPRLGTVEVRALDSQSALWSVAGLAALVHGLATAGAEQGAGGPDPPREALVESSFRAARDGLSATLWHDGALRPVPVVAAAALAVARPRLRELTGDDAALEGIDRILREGGGADRQRGAHARGGLPALLEMLVAEAAVRYA